MKLQTPITFADRPEGLHPAAESGFRYAVQTVFPNHIGEDFKTLEDSVYKSLSLEDEDIIGLYSEEGQQQFCAGITCAVSHQILRQSKMEAINDHRK